MSIARRTIFYVWATSPKQKRGPDEPDVMIEVIFPKGFKGSAVAMARRIDAGLIPRDECITHPDYRYAVGYGVTIVYNFGRHGRQRTVYH